MIAALSLVGDRKDENAIKMLERANKSFLPFTVMIFKDAEAVNSDIAGVSPYIEEQVMIDDKTTAYICENFSCRAPVTEVEQFKELVGIK